MLFQGNVPSNPSPQLGAHSIAERGDRCFGVLHFSTTNPEMLIGPCDGRTNMGIWVRSQKKEGKPNKLAGHRIWDPGPSVFERHFLGTQVCTSDLALSL